MKRFAALAVFAGLATLSAFWTQSQVTAVGGADATGWDSLIEILCSPYFMTLPVLPALVVGGAASAPSTGSLEVLVRHGSRTGSAVTSAVIHMLATIPYLVVWLVVGVMVAAPLRFTSWGAWTGTARAQTFAVGQVAPHLGPLAAVGAQVLLLASGAWAISTALAVLGAWTGRGRLMLGSCAVFLVWAYVSFRVPWPVSAWSKPITFFTLQHALAATPSFWVPALASVLASGAILALSLIGERHSGVHLHLGAAGVFAVTSAVALVGVELLRAPSTAGGDGLPVVFYGFGLERFDLVSVMLNLVLAAGPAVALQVSLADRLQHGLYAELIRCRNVASWWWRVHLRRAVLAAVIVPLAALAAHGLCVAALHGPDALAETQLAQVVYFVALTAGQVLVAAVLLAAVTLATGRATLGVWVLGAMVVASLPLLFRTLILPIGLDSLSLHLADVPAWRPAAVLIAWGAASIVVAVGITHRRGLQVA